MLKSNPKIYFHRDFKCFTGGHLKVWDYFQHAKKAGFISPSIYFTPESEWNNNPWTESGGVAYRGRMRSWCPGEADILFLAGMDWLSLPMRMRKKPPCQVVNLIQHVRHADPGHQLYEFLKYPATRVCVSEEVSSALRQSGIVNGEIITNCNGINKADMPSILSLPQKIISILIDGKKNPVLAEQISNRLKLKRVRGIEVVGKQLPRDKYLDLISKAEVTIFLPDKTEGFYLPALEGMALETFVICPDCIGNRSFCLSNENCLMPAYDVDDIISAALHYLDLTAERRKKILNNARLTSEKYSLTNERDGFLHILNGLCSRLG